MKRLLAAVMCLVLVFSMAAAQAVSLKDIVGRWYFVSIDDRGLDGKDYVVFNRDRSVTLFVGGNDIPTAGYTWKLSGDTVYIYTPENTILLSLDVTETGLRMLTSELSELFGVNGSVYFDLAREAVDYYTPEMTSAAAEEAFFGDFIPYLTASDGKYSAVETDEIVHIEEYIVKVSSDGDEKEYLTNFTDGKLIVYVDDRVIVVQTTSDPNVLAVYEEGRETEIIYYRRSGTEQPDSASEETEAEHTEALPEEQTDALPEETDDEQLPEA